MSLKPLVNSQRLWVTGGVPWRSAVSSCYSVARDAHVQLAERRPRTVRQPAGAGPQRRVRRQQGRSIRTRDLGAPKAAESSRPERTQAATTAAGQPSRRRSAKSGTTARPRLKPSDATQEGCHALNGRSLSGVRRRPPYNGLKPRRSGRAVHHPELYPGHDPDPYKTRRWIHALACPIAGAAAD